MKKNKRFIFFLAFLWAGITLSIFYTEISGCLDYVFLKIIGKSFSQRGKLIQMEVIVFYNEDVITTSSVEDVETGEEE